MRNAFFLPSRGTRWLPRAVPSHQLILVGFPSVGNIILLLLAASPGATCHQLLREGALRLFPLPVNRSRLPSSGYYPGPPAVPFPFFSDYVSTRVQ